MAADRHAATGQACVGALEKDPVPGGPTPVRWLRSLVGATQRPPARTMLSMRRYGALTAGALVLSGVQLALLPRWMNPRQFGLLVLGISVTQGLLQFGDLGLSRLCIDVTRSSEERARLRAEGQALSVATAFALAAVATVVALAWVDARPVAIALALGGVAGAAAVSDKYRALAREVAGDETAAAGLAFMSTNGPKIGLLSGLVAFRSALALLSVSAVVAAGLCLPVVRGSARAWAALRRPKVWAPPLFAILPSFVMGWADTYFLAARLGVSGAAAYEALFRVLGVSTYVFLPWVSVLVSRVSVAERRPLLKPILLSMSTTVFALGVAVLFVYSLAPSFFPRLPLPREALPGLIAYYLLLPLSYCLGSALYVRAELGAITRSLVAAMVVCLLGHAIFTLRGGPAEAAMVAALAMGLSVVLQTVAYVRLPSPAP